MKTRSSSIVSLTLLVALSAISAQAATSFGGTRYVKQTDATHTQSTKGTLSLDEGAQQLSFTDKGQQTVSIPYVGIRSMRFENSIDRLRQPFTHRVGRDQFLTVKYQAAENKPEYAIFRLNGRSYREVLAALETRTNKHVEYKAN